MKTMWRLLLAAAAFDSPAAIAQEGLPEHAGFYLGGALGQSEAQASCGQPFLIACEDKDSAWRLFGGFRFHRIVALEFGYADLGEPFSAQIMSGFGFPVHVGAKIRAWDVGVLLSVPIRRFSINFPVGLYRARTESTHLFGGYVTRTTSESNAGFTSGFGVGFDITNNLALRGEWRRYVAVGGGDIGEDDIDFLSAGLSWRF